MVNPLRIARNLSFHQEKEKKGFLVFSFEILRFLEEKETVYGKFPYFFLCLEEYYRKKELIQFKDSFFVGGARTYHLQKASSAV